MISPHQRSRACTPCDIAALRTRKQQGLTGRATAREVGAMELRDSRLFITGIGGFIGRRLAERARERGMTVSGLELSEAAAEAARAALGPGVDVRARDVHDAAALAEAIAGARVVVHTAAIVREDGDMEEFRHVNVRGPVAVAKAASEAGVALFVHLSSVMVHGFSFPDDVAEDGPLRGENNAYCQTKIESEAALAEIGARSGLGVIVIRPGDVYGPRSVPWVERPVELMRGGTFALPDGGRGILNHVHIDNLSDGILLAIEREKTGETYTLTDGARTTCREYFDALAAAAGAPRPRAIPAWLLKGVAGARAGVLRLLGRTPDMNASSVDYLLRPGRYSIDKARRELGYEPAIDLAEGMRGVAESLRR
jgi:nucleoside-diphosphate-sugar epimerase